MLCYDMICNVMICHVMYYHISYVTSRYIMLYYILFCLNENVMLSSDALTKVLMYCTAGVRCERASAFMRNKGVENVFQLEGGETKSIQLFITSIGSLI